MKEKDNQPVYSSIGRAMVYKTICFRFKSWYTKRVRAEGDLFSPNSSKERCWSNMKKAPNKDIEEYRQTTGIMASDSSYGNNGAFNIPYPRLNKNQVQETLFVVASDCENWDHVSVSTLGRCPTWNEMSHVKNLFWDAEETVIQYHPPASKYINNHPNVLHMWKPQGIDIPLPPQEFV